MHLQAHASTGESGSDMAIERAPEGESVSGSSSEPSGI